MVKIYNTIFFICLAMLSTFNATGQNLLENPSFETGEMAPWTAGNNNTVTIVEDPQDGTYAANGNIEQIVSLENGVNYTLTAYSKNFTPDLNVWVGIRDMVNAALVNNYLIISNDYEKATIEFTSQADGDHRFWVWGVNGTDYTSDNFILLKEGTSSVFETLREDERINIINDGAGVMVKVENTVKEATLSVHDLSGRMVYNRDITSGDTYVSNSNFSTAGIYIFTVQTAAGGKVSKVAVHPQR